MPPASQLFAFEMGAGALPSSCAKSQPSNASQVGFECGLSTFQRTCPQNTPPVVNAGNDQTLVPPLTVTLSGSVTDDNLPQPPSLTYQWSQVSGPTVTINNATALTATVSLSAMGVYVFRLSATDGDLTASDDVQVVAAPREGSIPVSALTLGSDGNFYGTTSAGGANGLGTVYRISPTGSFLTLATFNGANGATPASPLVQATDNNFYGTTTSGGTNNTGVIYRMTPSGALTVLYSVPTGWHGMRAGLIQATDGNLYGASHGLSSGGVTAFRMTLSGTVTPFAVPSSSAYLFVGGFTQASDGLLYGAIIQEPSGGVSMGFTMSTSGVFSDWYPPYNNISPNGPIIQASDGNFYGVSFVVYSGSSLSAVGNFFKIVAGIPQEILRFGAGSLYYGPDGGLIQLSDGNFYGTLTSGASIPPANNTNYQGASYRITPAGVVTILKGYINPTDTAQGLVPNGGLTLGLDGYLYGVTRLGGTHSQGTIFKVSTDGTTFTKLHDFNP